ncbi:four-jointed box protein 1-like [Mercenaria mercenaria]|uniref:four-jointed box protein 1-like n=1 Tax=Mercenaria mercenaria TaxID=6596 RepID=UPI00234E8CD5|nr:four-jointed box protein 1-like [Mercenaria mercenaria]XP_053396152.1 four-jointed box protein 1-like [Mercenaria mercenaria]XP_053396153.1 four-jointed box protein 1-like [Mercenaria mercenaria]XP_053396154.1 four-jointed box protein 1-like [Mercenaria mercenaria]
MMERRFRYLFTLCFIMGFQIHMPVTMFPAESSMSKVNQNTSELNDLVLTESELNEKYTPKSYDKDLNVVEYVQFHSRSREHVKAAGAIGSEAIQLDQLNKNTNQASLVDLHDFNEGIKLNGLERDLSTDRIKSAKSVINRLPEDLRAGKLEQIQQKLANLSANLLTRKNILPGNNRRPVVKGREINKDGGDKYNNNTVIKSEQSQSTHTNLNWILGDKVPSTSKTSMSGILWPSVIVDKCPQGFRKEEQVAWKRKVENFDIVKVEAGCGSMQNRLITFNDSTRACVRYRMNTDQLQGEIYSYYLSNLLGMHYTPPTTLHKVENSRQWRDVGEDIIAAKWSENKPIIVTKWIESLEPVYMPDQMKDMKRKLHQENYQLYDMADGDLCDLVQWTDLIIFDYISANLDRVVNNVFNLKWNHKMLEKPIHNLEKSKRTGQFVFVDNESGLFHGYRLLETYGEYHKALLDKVCIFRPSTAQAIETLYAKGDAGLRVQQLYEDSEQLHGHLPRMHAKNMQMLQSRINDVYKHMQLCRHIS